MTIFTLASITSSPAVRRRLTLLGALCMLTSLLPIVYPSLFTSSINAQSQLRYSLYPQISRVGSIRMEAANDKIVPSIVVYVTVPNKDAGKKLAGSIVKEKLAACVNRVPGIESVYLWQGEIQTDSEELLIIKTRESLLDALTEHVKANHEYEVAEVIALPITGGSLPYLEWLKNSTRD
ncbi:hypothetical protein L6452_35028 [Arctium lappa]|uniref:Uncharacterized protein n=1 Tax=Arctium lappa TaxID=4217 RepID=A0ACB8YL10_ARCLA|nr:hypothetical protein L6452_35028 [Arctium lappa]